MKEWEDKFDKEKKLKLIEDQIKDTKIKERDQLKKVIGEQGDLKLQEELFSKLEDFEIEKSKKN